MNILPWIGVPYKPHGNPPESADCWTLVKAFAEQELGLHYPAYMYDTEHLQITASICIDEEVGPMGRRWMRVDSPEVGDVLLFRMQGLVSHCGIWIGEFMLHTLKGRASCIEPLSAGWETRLFGIYRWNENA